MAKHNEGTGRTPHPGRLLWTERSPLNPTTRMRLHGPIQPMDKPNLFERFFGMR